MADAARSSTALCVYRGISVLIEAALDSPSVVVGLPIAELQRVSFELTNQEEDTEYRLRLGAGVDSTGVATASGGTWTIGHARRGVVTWDELQYFESARGRTPIVLESRRENSARWENRLVLQFTIVPSKIGEVRFQRMLDDLTGLATGLVLDLVSKSSVSLGFRVTPSEVFTGSSQLELRTLESSWQRIAGALKRIEREPSLGIERSLMRRNFWGPERLGSRGVRHLVAAGTNVRSTAAALPIGMVVECVRESSDTVEHRTIAAFLDLLVARARDCHRNALSQAQAIDRDRAFRDIPQPDGTSLFAEFDLPRIERLRAASERALGLSARMARARDLPFLRGIRSEPGSMRTQVFQHVPAYRDIRAAATNFLTASSVVIEDGAEEQLKSTSRMYEQWVFLQLLAAFRACGVQTADGKRLVRSVGRQRFTLDIDRGSRVEFKARDGRTIVIRYEPWVLPRQEANSRRDTVYRGRDGAAPWSPDILIEVLRDDAEEGVPNNVEYAVVVDAKYSSVIRDDHWESASKYLEIRSTRSDRQTVFQSWLAFPGQDRSILFRDSAIEWLDTGPTLPVGDFSVGRVSLLPDAISDVQSSESGMRISDVALRFVRGMLIYLRFAEVLKARSVGTDSAD